MAMSTDDDLLKYQQKFLNVKGAELELAHRNSQASVPFAL